MCVVPVIPMFKCSFHRVCLCLCMSEVISRFSALSVGLQVFSLLILIRLLFSNFFVIGPGEGECLLVRGVGVFRWYTQYGWCVCC